MNPGTAVSQPVEKQFMRTGLGYDEDLDVLAWCGGILPSFGPDEVEAPIDPGVLFYIRTLEGDMAVTVGDVVIRGVHGEFYPCKPDIFAQTYDVKTEPSA